MTVKYVGWHSNDDFTCGREYNTQVTVDGLMVVDNTGNKHIIATKDNPYKSYQEDDFFRHNFVIV